MGNVVTLEDGMKAPLFSAEDSEGNVWNLSDILAEGKRVILYFYPKDSTPGCTTQACDFRVRRISPSLESQKTVQNPTRNLLRSRT